MQTPPNMENQERIWENSDPPKKSDQKTQTNTFKRCLHSPLTILISWKYCFCHTACDNKVTRPSTMPNEPGITLSPHVRESKTVSDSRSSDWIPELLELHSGFQSPAIRIPLSKLSLIPKSRFPHMGSVLGLLRSLRAQLSEAIKPQNVHANLVARSPTHFLFQNCNTTQRLIMQKTMENQRIT